MLTPADLLDIFESHGIDQEKAERGIETVYARSPGCGKIQRGRDYLVGLLRPYPCKQLSNLL